MNISKIALTLGLSSALGLSACSDTDSIKQNDPQVNEQSNGENEGDKTLTKDEAKSRVNEFEDRILPQTNDESKVENYDTKQELIDYVSKIASEDLVKTWVNKIYEERDGGLYLKTNEEYQQFLVKEQKFKLNQIEEGKYKLIQTNNTEVNGKSTLTAVLEFHNGLYRVMKLDVSSSSS